MTTYQIVVVILTGGWLIWLIRVLKRSLFYQKERAYGKLIENNLRMANGNIIFVVVVMLVWLAHLFVYE